MQSVYLWRCSAEERGGRREEGKKRLEKEGKRRCRLGLMQREMGTGLPLIKGFSACAQRLLSHSA